MRRDRAAPVVEADDFEDEAQRDAESYTTRRKDEAAAQALKEENRRRKQLGLSPARKPKIVNGRSGRESTAKLGFSSPRRRLFEGTTERHGTSSGSHSSDEETDGTVRGKRKRISDRDFRYEGQVILGLNPLERIAELEVSPRGRARSAYTASSERNKGEPRGLEVAGTRDVKPDLMPDVKPDIKPVLPLCIGNGFQGDLKPGNNSLGDVKPDILGEVDVKPVIDDGEEEEEEGTYDAIDDYVILPDGPLPAFAAEAETMEEDAYYSDDQLFAQGKPTSSESPSTESSFRDDGVPSVKPDFLDDDEMPLGEPLALGGDIAVPAPLNRYLKSYQREGVKFFYDKYAAGKGFVLGDEMGLGKTIQVIAFLSAVMRKTGTVQDYKRRKTLVRRTPEGIKAKHWPTALIVCPKFLIRNWQREFAAWGYFEVGVWQTDTVKTVKQDLERGYLDVVLASYETTRNTIDLLKDMPFSVVIVDEAHRLKEPKARLTLALKKFTKPTCFALTGTLIQNRMEEIWSLLDFVDRGWAGTRTQWKDFVVDPLRKGFRFDTVIADFVEACTRLGIMHDRVMPYFYLRRDKRLIADELPEKQDRVVFCPLADRQIQAYRSYIASPDVQFILRRKDPCDCGSDKERGQCCYKLTPDGETLRQVLLKSINAMTKVANHLGLLYHMDADSETTQEANRRIFQACMGEEYDPRVHRARDATLDPANCGKWTLLRRMLTEWRNEPEAKNKVLIFSNSVRLLKMIEDFITMTMDGFNYNMITGEVDIDTRMDMVDRFQDPAQDEYILLISTLAGGVGLNLTAANKVVIFDPAWNPASDLQAMDRAFRIGQKRTVEVYRLIGQGTLEELMYERQIQKQQRARQLNEGTFENRLHQGMEKGRTKEEQGELFGVQNIFKFDPNGFVPGRIERVQQAQDKFVADLIEAEYDDEEEIIDEDEEAEAARVKTLQGRKQRELERAKTIRARRNDEVVESVLGEADVRETREESLFRSLNITTQAHDSVFQDSPEERAIFEIGLKILKNNPEVAKHMRANDVGTYRGLKTKNGKDREKGSSAKKVRQAGDPENEPWKHRRRPDGKSVLAELSD